MKNLQLISMIAMTLVATAANAQWTVTRLHPAGSVFSIGYGSGGANQAGWTQVSSGETHASLWRGTAASWVDLHPAGAYGSTVQATTSTHQVGYAEVDNSVHAGYWTGSAASWVDLHPAGGWISEAWGAWGTFQVGFVQVNEFWHASLWSGSAASWVDLHPAGASGSGAIGVSGANQVGSAIFGGQRHAGLWRGSASSWVDLNPTGATESEAFGTSGASQVGYARVGGVRRAGLWKGSAASWVDLQPASASWSIAEGVWGEQQVGSVDSQASVWTGTAASCVNLHGFLPAEFSFSWARSIYDDGSKVYIVGTGFNAVANRYEALLWTRPVFGLASFTIAPSGVVSGNQATGIVTVSRPAPSGGLVVSLIDNSAALITPQSVTVPEGETSASFQIGTTVTSVQIMRQVKATLNGSIMTRNLIVILPDITTLNANPKVLIGGTNSIGTVTANGTTGNGFVVTLTSGGPEVIVPASVTFSYGARSKSFTISTLPVSSTTVRVITANRNGRTRTVTMTVTRQ